MSDSNETGRDGIDAQVTQKLRSLRLAQPIPAPQAGEPSDEELLRYVDGAVSGGEREKLEERIAASPYASARVAVVVEALRECGYPLPSKETIAKKVARYVFRYAEGALTFLRGSDMPDALAPALQVRGAATTQDDTYYEFTHQFDAVAARLQVERVEGRGFELQLTLSEKDAPVDGARVTLRQSGKTVDSASTEAGKCAFGDLPAARYQLDVKRGSDEIGTLHVDVIAP
jgi:hypothetical protein